MLIHRYNRTDLFAPVPRFGLRFEPQLEQLDRLLDDDAIVEAIRSDTARRSPRSRSRGRPSTPVEVVPRMLVVMRLYSRSYEQAEYFVNDSLVLRQFCRVYLERVPDDTTLIRWANTLGPETLERLNDRVVQLARERKVTRGRKLRVDTTAVETNIHFPTDSGLVGDGVRVVSAASCAGPRLALGEAASGLKEAFRSRVRTVRKPSQQLHRIARRKNEQGRAALKAAHGRLVRYGQADRGPGPAGAFEARQREGDDAERRGWPGDSMRSCPGSGGPSAMACVASLRRTRCPPARSWCLRSEPHTQVIPRFKAGQAGRVRPQAEGARRGRGWADHRVRGAAAGRRPGPAVPGRRGLDPAMGDTSVARRALLAADRGMASAENERLAREAGGKHVALPHVGKAPPERRAEEKGRRFREAYRSRAGIEGRIHALEAGNYGLKRCRYLGERGFGRWVGWGVVAHNLAKVAGSARG